MSTVVNLVSEVDRKILDYMKTFGDLKSRFQEWSTLRIEITVFRILDKLEEIGACFVCWCMHHSNILYMQLLK